MRYQNWDVLVFPLLGDSKTPLQEFGTACTVNQDPGEDSPTLRLPTTAVTYINRRHALQKPFRSPSLLHRREGPFADCLVLHS